MHVHGSCHCGAIRYEAEVDPDKVVLCHCADCQQFAGAPYRAMVRPLPNTLGMTGTPTHYTKTADSGRQRVQAFCGTCGTQVAEAIATSRVFWSTAITDHVANAGDAGPKHRTAVITYDANLDAMCEWKP